MTHKPFCKNSSPNCLLTSNWVARSDRSAVEQVSHYAHLHVCNGWWSCGVNRDIKAGSATFVYITQYRVVGGGVAFETPGDEEG